MKLSWNEIRARAARFAKDWKGRGYEKGETQLFYRDFFEIFGMNVIRVATFEEPVLKLGHKRGFIDLFWPGTLLVEQKSAGRDLEAARRQALEYFPGLPDAELPKYLLLSDFQNFELYDAAESLHAPKACFPLAELPDYAELFAFVRGDVVDFLEKQEAVTVRASEMMAELHDLLRDSGFAGRDLQVLLIRLVFCLFAENTGIFEQNAFLKLVRNRSAEGGRDLGRLLAEFFDVLNTPEGERQKLLEEELACFPYINGALFAEKTSIPVFDARMREVLIAACEFDWREVSPAIFGSLFQAVMDERERREQGAHYTSEQNILKVIGPLFLDGLHAEFKKIQRQKGAKRAKTAAFRKFHARLARLNFLDPACGCGNFLVVTYQQLRHLETLLLKELYPADQQHLDVRELSLINVDRFHGIELGEFPAKIAQIALWMTDHLCNIELGNTFGQAYSRIPLVTAPNIRCADALELDWEKVLKAKKCSYVLGNPPFVGAKLQSPKQRGQVRDVARLGKSGGTLDYVCAWFIKAGEYLQKNKNIRIGFVSTNSITQGDQAGQLWPVLFGRHKLAIAFAHRTFNWTNEARGKAHVHCVIIGLAHQTNAPQEKRLFSYGDPKGEPKETMHKAISPYLTDAEKLKDPHLTVREENRPLMGYPPLVMGSKPIDNGSYIFTAEQKAEFLQKEPKAERFFRPFVGSAEFINNRARYILALQDASPKEMNSLPEVKKRMEAVREFRLKSRNLLTQKLADTPTLYHLNVIPKAPFLVIPRVSSENRGYIPIGYLKPPIIPSDATLLMLDAELWHFAVLTSRMHMAWTRQFGGRLGSSYRYSIGLCYNPFPWPAGLKENEKAQEKLSAMAQDILDARAAHPDSSLADLYNPTTMPPGLRRAHAALDRYVDSLYRKTDFADDKERVNHLFALYEAMMARGKLSIP